MPITSQRNSKMQKHAGGKTDCSWLKQRVRGEFLLAADIRKASKPNQLSIAATILPQCERYSVLSNVIERYRKTSYVIVLIRVILVSS